MLFSAGATNGANNTDQIAEAVRVSQQADATVLFVGDTHVAEFSDRTWYAKNGLSVHIFVLKLIILPRQARHKHKINSKRDVLS